MSADYKQMLYILLLLTSIVIERLLLLTSIVIERLLLLTSIVIERLLHSELHGLPADFHRYF
jgi:hypothetical protein